MGGAETGAAGVVGGVGVLALVMGGAVGGGRGVEVVGGGGGVLVSGATGVSGGASTGGWYPFGLGRISTSPL